MNKNILFIAEHLHYKEWKGKNYYDLLNFIKINNSEYKIILHYSNDAITDIIDNIKKHKPLFILFFITRTFDITCGVLDIEKIINLNYKCGAVLLDICDVNFITSDKYIKKMNYLLHFCKNKSFINTYSKLYPNKIINTIPSRYINIEKFKDYNLEKKYDILIYGTMEVKKNYKNEPLESIKNWVSKYENKNNKIINEKINVYPLRQKVRNLLLKNSHKFNIKILDPACIYDAKIANEELSKLINQSYLTLACCTIADIMMHKYIEISASNSCILGNIPSDYKDLFQNNIIEIDEFMSDSEILKIIENALNDKKLLIEKSNRLYNIIHKEHNYKKAIEDFNILFDQIKSNK